MEVINSISTFISAISTVSLAFIAFFQLRGLRKNNTLKVVFDIEREINQRKVQMDAIAAEAQMQLLGIVHN